MTAAELWDQLHDLFDTDDGSLPDIEINNLSGEEVVNIYAYLRAQSELTSNEQYFWSKTENKDVQVDSVANAALLVVSGEAEAFHIVVRGLAFGGAGIPDLGIFVFEDSISLDYRMGPEWGPAELNALFLCFCKILKIAPLAQVILPLIDYWNKRFNTALRQY
jgi:hypothetical protein